MTIFKFKIKKRKLRPLVFKKKIVIRIVVFLLLWIILWFWSVNFYIKTFPFNNPQSLSGLEELNKKTQDELVFKIMNFFDSKIGAQNFSYDIVAYNEFRLAIEATEPPLTYRNSLMTFFLNGEPKEVPYQKITNLVQGLRKDEILSLIESVKFIPEKNEDIGEILLAPNATLKISTVGRGFVSQNLDRDSKIILFILIPFLLIWLGGTIKIFLDILRNGLISKREMNNVLRSKSVEEVK